jgi:hypothetical protein
MEVITVSSSAQNPTAISTILSGTDPPKTSLVIRTGAAMLSHSNAAHNVARWIR